MAKLTDNLKDKILSDFHIGKSQNWLAENYNLSPATINKLCKGITPKYKDKVNGVVAIKSELSKESEYQVFTFDKEVNEMLRRKNLVYGVSEKIVKKAGDMLESIDSATDLKALADTVDKSSLTLGINQRHSNSQVNIQNTNAQQNNIETRTLDDFYNQN